LIAAKFHTALLPLEK